MLRIEGHIVNHDEEFDGAIVVDTETGLIDSVERGLTGASDVDAAAGAQVFELLVIIVA